MTTVNPAVVSKDGSFNALVCNTDTTRGKPAKDIRFSNVNVGEDQALGRTPQNADLSVTAMAVSGIVSGGGVLCGNAGTGLIGHV